MNIRRGKIENIRSIIFS